jgi:uracil-DNA glycosylase family 4
MSLDLDARQRAMLAEMQVPVWWPAAVKEAAPEPAAAPDPVAVAVAGESAAPAPVRAGMQSLAQAIQSAPELIAASAGITSASGQKSIESADLPIAGDVAAMDMATLRAAWRACLASRPLAVAEGASPDWLVLGEALAIGDDLAGTPFVGDAGLLLANMLYAAGIQPRSPQRSAQLTSVQKLRAAELADADPLVQSAPYLARHVTLLQPKLILALGPFAAQLLLRDSTPLGQLRGRVHRYLGVPVVVSYAPATLLRNPAEKAKAWADLCLAMSASA